MGKTGKTYSNGSGLDWARWDCRHPREFVDVELCEAAGKTHRSDAAAAGLHQTEHACIQIKLGCYLRTPRLRPHPLPPPLRSLLGHYPSPPPYIQRIHTLPYQVEQTALRIAHPSYSYTGTVAYRRLYRCLLARGLKAVCAAQAYREAARVLLQRESERISHHLLRHLHLSGLPLKLHRHPGHFGRVHLGVGH